MPIDFKKEKDEMAIKKVKPMFWLLAIIVLTGLIGCGDSSENKNENPSNTYPNVNLLMSADDLEDQISNRDLTTAADDTLIIDTRSQTAFEAGHIPGAVNITWQTFCNFPGGKLKAVAEIETILGNLGISRTMNFLIYDNTLASWGSAGRMFWMLDYLGCPNIQILNGGWDKWVADGKDTESGPSETNLEPVVFTAEIKADLNPTSDYIHNRLGSNDFAVIDSRTDEEYNGWQLYGEVRGGHMTGAVQIPYAWFYNAEDKTILEYSQMKELLESRGITTDKEVTSYCTAGIRSGFVYFALKLMGYKVISNYDGSMWEWAADSSLPMEKMARYDELVYAGWIKALIDYHSSGSTSEAPVNYNYDRDHKYLIFETQWGSFEDMEKGWADNSYLTGHIPGAIHSNSDVYENGFPRWFLLPEDELKASVGSMGITADTTVVVYSNNPIFATRLWWILKYAGVEDVRVLNGGYGAWIASGGESETTINEPVPVTYDGTLHPEYIATTDDVAANYDTSDTLMADVRTMDEYIGKVSGYSYVVQKGRIPGAVYAFNADNPDREYLDADDTIRSYTEVRTLWEDLGITSSTASNVFDKEVIFYCGSGYRSSLSFLHAYLMGYDNVRNYSDGWEGWSTDYVEDPAYVADPAIPGSTDGWIQNPSGRPVATGEPE